MTELEYKILTYVESNPNVHWVKLLNDMHPCSSYKKTGAVAEGLLADNLLENTTPSEQAPHCCIRLSVMGANALLREEERLLREEQIRQDQIRCEEANEQKRLEQIAADKAERHAEQKAEHRFQAKLSLGSAAFGAVLGAIFSNLDRLIPFIIQLVS